MRFSTKEDGSFDKGFLDTTRDVWVMRNVAWRRRSAKAGNHGVGLGGWFVAMGIRGQYLPRSQSDRSVGRGLLDFSLCQFCPNLTNLCGVLSMLPTFVAIII